MFEQCKTLAELNAARIKETSNGTSLVEVNNAYNQRRQEILMVKKNYVKLEPIHVKAREVNKYCGVPVAGRSNKAGCIELTKSGFLY